MFKFKSSERKGKKNQLKDSKSWLRFNFWNFINHIIMKVHFKEVTIYGKENLPDGAFILVANHSSRWDGPVVQYLLNRKANYMVSPNEMKGLQGRAVKSVGAFPASSKRYLVTYSMERLLRNEPIVVFPEGNIYRDDYLHPFQKGAARIAIEADARNQGVPIVPLAIEYSNEGGYKVVCRVGKPFMPNVFEAPLLAEEMHFKVNSLKLKNNQLIEAA